MNLDKNAVINTTIEGIGVNGEGIAKIDGKPVFIPYTLPGEKITAKIVADKKTHAFGKVTDIIAPADERAREECPVFGKCGGCQIQHMKYKDQLAFKTIVVKDTLKKIGKINCDVPVCIKSDLKYKYRNKLQLPVGVTNDNKLVIGFYANNSHRIVNINGCPLHPDWNEKVIDIVKKFMTRHAIPGYNEETRTGVVRHIVVREVNKTLQITVVVNADDLKYKDELVQSFNEAFPVPSIYLNINKEDTNVILGETFLCISGARDISGVSTDHKILVSPNSFLQVNNQVKDKIYSRAFEISGVTQKDTVIDAYSGIGVLSSLFADAANHVYAVEIVPQAIQNANYVARENSLTDKMTNILGDCAEEIPKLLTALREPADGKNILILDPPRKGADSRVIDAVLQSLPDKVIYISCNPATLARDCGMLTGSIDLPKYHTDTPRYELSFIQPYDMFPQTKHVETLVLLSKKTDTQADQSESV